jgi:long-chain acyl-CoA synthetase
MSSVYATRFWKKSWEWKTPDTIKYPKMPAYAILRNASVFQPDKVATWFYGAEITYNDLYLKVTRLANVLVEQGVKKGDCVGMLLPNCPQCVMAFWAILMAGGVVVNLNPLYTKDELRFLFDDTTPKALFTYDAILPMVKELNQESKTPIAAVIVTKLSDFMAGTPKSTAADLGLGEGYLHLSEVLDTDKRWAPPLVDIKYDDNAVIQYTGGTTGAPKGAVLTQYNIVAAAIQVVRWCSDFVDSEPVERRRVLCILPYSHIYGEVCAILYPVFQTATMVLLPRWETDEVFDVLNHFDHFSYFPAVPTMLQGLFYNPRVDEIDWHRKIGYCGSGAAPAPLPLIQKCRSKDFNFCEGWGMSETCALGLSTPNAAIFRQNSVGVPTVDMDIRIVGEDGVDLPLGQEGEIWIKGAMVMKEYWHRPEETADAFVDGWLRTGDIAYMDEDGYVFIVDRLKDLILAGGFNIYPRDVDEVLLKHPKVADAMVIGVPDEYRGETVKAFIQLMAGETATPEELIAFCRESLAAYKVPHLFEFRSELPRTATGKALRRILKEEEEKARIEAASAKAEK